MSNQNVNALIRIANYYVHLGETRFVLEVHWHQLMVDSITIDRFFDVIAKPQIANQSLLIQFNS